METKGDKMENRILVSKAVGAFRLDLVLQKVLFFSRFLLPVDYLCLHQKFQPRLILTFTTLTCSQLKAKN